MNIKIPHEPFNTLVRDYKAGDILKNIIKELKPESIYFTEQDGTQGAVAIVDINHCSTMISTG